MATMIASLTLLASLSHVTKGGGSSDGTDVNVYGQGGDGPTVMFKGDRTTWLPPIRTATCT
jgi:hypothetical protein